MNSTFFNVSKKGTWESASLAFSRRLSQSKKGLQQGGSEASSWAEAAHPLHASN